MIDTFYRAYLECAAWADAPEGQTQLDFTKAAIEEAKTDCVAFVDKFRILIEHDPEQAGHDFWLSRNGHGTGFWDREEIWGEKVAQYLNEASKAFGQKHIEVVGRGGSRRLAFF